MNSLIKIAALCAGLVLAGCHIDGDPNIGHDEDGNILTSDGKPCITSNSINIYGFIVSSPAREILLSKSGFDSGSDGLTVYTTNDQPVIGIQITNRSNCLVFLGELSRTEFARTLGIKTFPRGIDQEGDKR